MLLPPGIKQVQMQLYPRALLLTANTLIVPQQGVCVYVCVFKCELDFMYSVSEWMIVLESLSPILRGFPYQELEKRWRKGRELPKYDVHKWTFKTIIQLNTATQSGENTFVLSHTL